MTKITKILATSALALSVLPIAASAHSNDTNKSGDGDHKPAIARSFMNFKDGKDGFENDFREHFINKFFSGTVTAVGANSLTISASDGKVYTVDTTNAKLVKPFAGAIAFADIKVNDKVQVMGKLNGTTIAAKFVSDMPINTHPAMTTGTITAVSGNTITVQNTHTGVVSNVTVNTDANTQVTKDGQPATLADATVGTTVKVKGLWNETLNVLNAIKINIKSLFSNK